MTAAYSEDLRCKVILTDESGGMTQQEIADQFHIHLSTVKRILRRYRITGETKVKPNEAGRPRRIDAAGEKKIANYIKQKPDATLIDISEFYQGESGQLLAQSIICRVLQKLNLNRKKKSHYAQEQERDDVKKKGKHF